MNFSKEDDMAVEAIQARWNSIDYKDESIETFTVSRDEWPFSGDHLYP